MRTTAILAVAVALCACSGSNGISDGNVDVRGTYGGTLVNGESTCPGNWVTGDTHGVTVIATQAGDNVTLDVTSNEGLVLELLLGAHTFNGKVSGHHVTTMLRGARSIDDGACHYAWSAKFEGELVDDTTLQGGIIYTPQTNDSPDCQAKQIQGCSSIQTWSGTRPQ